ncbi:MAG: IclR family transcriptional regulator [Phycisphaerae bacterium]
MALPAQPNQSLIDGLACLQAISVADEAVGTRQLARQLGLETTRVSRLLGTLAHLGLAEKDENRRYRPGPAVHVLAAQAMFGSGLLRRAMKHLDELRQTGLMVAMGVLWQDRVTYLYHGSAETPPAEAIGHVRLYPARRSGLGLALLAERTFAQIDALYRGAARREVKQAVRQTRRRGYALAQRDDGRTLGAALQGGHAAIGLAGAFADTDIPRLVERLTVAARRIDSET